MHFKMFITALCIIFLMKLQAMAKSKSLYKKEMQSFTSHSPTATHHYPSPILFLVKGFSILPFYYFIFQSDSIPS